MAGRDHGNATALATELESELGIEVRALPSYEQATDDADIVFAVTHPVDPAATSLASTRTRVDRDRPRAVLLPGRGLTRSPVESTSQPASRHPSHELPSTDVTALVETTMLAAVAAQVDRETWRRAHPACQSQNSSARPSMGCAGTHRWPGWRDE